MNCTTLYNPLINSSPTTAMNWYGARTAVLSSSNSQYQELARDFFEKYASSNTLGIHAISHYYNNDTLISFHIHQNGVNYLYEIIGHNNFKNKLAEIGILYIKYHSITHTAQPVGKKCVMITFYGQAELAGKNFQVESTILFRIVSGSPRIINQILNIFL